MYDIYKLFNRDLSCIVIESILAPSFCEVTNTRFSIYEDFENITGQVCFTMIINACNNYTASDIEDPENYFSELSLDEFSRKKSLILLPICLGISRLCAARMIFLQKLAQLFF